MVRLIAMAAAGALAILMAGASAARGCASDDEVHLGFVLDHVAADDARSLLEFIVVRMERTSDAASMPADAAARSQAERFAAFLHDADPAAFTHMMNAMLDGCRVGEAVRMSYGAHVNALWVRFVEEVRDDAPQPREIQ